MPTPDALLGVGVLVTRPAHQAEDLARRVRDLGGEAVLAPALVIEPLADRPGKALSPSRLEAFDLAIFVSPNAARIATARLRSAGGLPPALRLAAIGPGTAKALQEAGAREVLTGRQGFDSESLLEALPAGGISGWRIAVVRGEGGRELLGRALQDRGALVEHFEVYRRVRPEGGLEALLPGWRRGNIGATVATSAEIVENLYAMASDAGADCVRGTPMFVPHPRVAAAAHRLGTRQVMVAGVGDAALVEAMTTWFGRERPPPLESNS